MNSALKYLIGFLFSAFVITATTFEAHLPGFIISFALCLIGAFIAFYFKEKHLAWGILTSVLILFGFFVFVLIMASQLH